MSDEPIEGLLISKKGIEAPQVFTGFIWPKGSSWLCPGRTAAASKRAASETDSYDRASRSILQNVLGPRLRGNLRLRLGSAHPSIWERLVFHHLLSMSERRARRARSSSSRTSPGSAATTARTCATFLGHDYELLMHEISTFAVADIWFQQHRLSILCTFLASFGEDREEILGGRKFVGADFGSRCCSISMHVPHAWRFLV